MKKLVFLGLLVCYLALVAKFYHYGAYTLGGIPHVPGDWLEAAISVAAEFAGAVAASMTDPMTIFMAIICLALGATRKRLLFAVTTAVAVSIATVIDLYSYWAEIGGISVPELSMRILLTNLFVGSIAFWIGLGLRTILKPNAAPAAGDIVDTKLKQTT